MHFFKKVAFGIAFNMGALYVTVELLDKVTYSGGWLAFVVTGVLIGVLNTFVRPLIRFFSLPLILVSGGLFLIIINALILWMATSLLHLLDFSGLDFHIEGAVTFVLAALVFGITNWFEHWVFKRLR
ncbi:MAG: hypothetical protein UT55_C0015G0003 [Candidatus Peregrinibacteria bacterium GW2011_GWE2_39_6]|nr:MAG: hypothetical protein UT36_C0010G0049 [Candidatus Peregrinibacteria bacterium GW2011_GWF2_39_17]KKR26173.1 MAG: hypothetical protein UT55_C0015G0003 [Candidatus Peregrinibacteria bacterium GW2011_GWE2_39_6]HCW32295.1 hypothetical protein [Candidatus Peregrinibacteria bacterium]